MRDTRKQKANKIKSSEMPIKHSPVRGEHADRIVGSPSWQSSVNFNRSMPEDLKLSQIGSSPLPPPFKGLHSPGVRKHCQIIFACYFRKSSIIYWPQCVYVCVDPVQACRRGSSKTCPTWWRFSARAPHSVPASSSTPSPSTPSRTTRCWRLSV